MFVAQVFGQYETLPANLTGVNQFMPVMAAGYGLAPSGVWLAQAVTENGYIKTAKPPPTAPPNTTEVTILISSEINGTINTAIKITDGKVITINRLKGSAAGSIEGSLVTLFYDPVGNEDENDFILIEIPMNVNSNNDEFNLNFNQLGDTVNKIILQRDRLDGGNKLVSASINGFESTP